MTYDADMSDGTVAFTLTEDVPAVSFIGITEDNSVEVSYKLNVVSVASRLKAKGVYIGLVILLLETALSYCIIF